MANKIRRGDYVKVITGKDKGKIGKVLIMKNHLAIVDKVNLHSKHIKSNQNNHEGGIVKKEGLIHISNVLYYCKENEIASRIGFKINDKKKVRFLKINNTIINEK